MREEDTHNTKGTVMLHALRSLVLLVPVLLQLWCTAVRAEGSADVHVVLAFDVSGSMFTNAIPNHAAIQAAALNSFFQNYGNTCVRVQIDFMPWGDNADVVTGATIASADGARALWLKIGLSAVTSRGGTNHAKAFKVALARFVNPHTNNILVFSTDEAGSTIHSAGNQLSDLVPKNVSV